MRAKQRPTGLDVVSWHSAQAWRLSLPFPFATRSLRSPRAPRASRAGLRVAEYIFFDPPLILTNFRLFLSLILLASRVPPPTLL